MDRVRESEIFNIHVQGYDIKGQGRNLFDFWLVKLNRFFYNTVVWFLSRGFNMIFSNFYRNGS